jgi:hypothetical protein
MSIADSQDILDSNISAYYVRIEYYELLSSLEQGVMAALRQRVIRGRAPWLL